MGGGLVPFELKCPSISNDLLFREKKLRAIIQTGDEKLEDQKKTYEMQLVAVRSEFASRCEQRMRIIKVQFLCPSRLA